MQVYGLGIIIYNDNSWGNVVKSPMNTKKSLDFGDKTGCKLSYCWRKNPSSALKRPY